MGQKRDRGLVQRLRAMLRALGLCPEGDIGKDPDYAVWESNARAELHDLVERVQRQDLWALREVAWLLTG